jgi:hypothetical protein
MDPWCQDRAVWRIWGEDGGEVIERVEEEDCPSGGSDGDDVGAVEVG